MIFGDNKMKQILDMVQEYQDAVSSLRLNDVRSNSVSNSVVKAALIIAEYHPVVVIHAREAVANLLLHSKKILAIKVYKDLVGVSLKEAKDVVDSMHAELQTYVEKVTDERLSELSSDEVRL